MCACRWRRRVVRSPRRPLSNAATGRSPSVREPVMTPVIGRNALDRRPRQGPFIVEDYDCTCVVPPIAFASAGRHRQHRDRGDPTMSRVDPITLEVIRNGPSSIADEMAPIIMRSAYSPVVRDIMDYSTGLCDPQVAASSLRRTDAAHPALLLSAGDALFEGAVRRRHGAGRRLHHQRPLWLGRTASAGCLCAEADLPSEAHSPASPQRWRTIPTLAASCREAWRSTPPRSSRKACASR